MRSAEMYERGALGERATGAILDALRAEGWAVFHDVRWPDRVRANIDHVVVGPPGLFVIDSKNWSGRIDVRGETFTCRGRRHDRTVAAAGDAALAVAGGVGAPAAGSVRSVLCFVRDEPVEGLCHEVLLCSTGNLRQMLLSRPAVLTPDQVRMAALELDILLRSASIPTPAPARRQVTVPLPTTHPTRRRPKRKKTITGQLVGLVVTVLVAFAGLSQLPRIADLASRTITDQLVETRFGSCKELRAEYRNGVGTVAAVNELKRRRKGPSADPAVYAANAGLDKDGDGLACERAE